MTGDVPRRFPYHTDCRPDPDVVSRVKHAAFTLEGTDFAAMNEMMPSDDRTAIARITNAFLAMRKFDLAARGKAYQNH